MDVVIISLFLSIIKNQKVIDLFSHFPRQKVRLQLAGRCFFFRLYLLFRLFNYLQEKVVVIIQDV